MVQHAVEGVAVVEAEGEEWGRGKMENVVEGGPKQVQRTCNIFMALRTMYPGGWFAGGGGGGKMTLWITLANLVPAAPCPRLATVG